MGIRMRYSIPALLGRCGLPVAVVACMFMVTIAEAAGPATPSAANAPAVSNPIRDAALKDFLQKKFRIGSANEIALGPMLKTALPGIFQRQVTVTNEKGQSGSAILFTDQNESKAMLGEFLAFGPMQKMSL